ncbi:MAG: hypothetical protein ACE5EX_11330 [Phycisphaerae bacterium]
MTSQKKKVYVALLLCGGVALSVDRCVLSEPVAGPESALATVPPATDTQKSDLVGTDDATLPIPRLPFPEGVQSFDPALYLRDFFAPPAAVLVRVAGSENQPGRSPGGSTKEPLRLTAAALKAAHRLRAVILHQRQRVAIVDDLWVHVGQTLDGCTLTALSGNSARFECRDGAAVLHVAATLNVPGG